MKLPSLSVIICTRDRADSLRITLEALAGADRTGLFAEVIVMDNGSKDDTSQVVETFKERLPVRYVYEATTGVYGKSHSLNRALASGGLGDLVAVLDDDMTVAHDWFQGVLAISRRHPEAGLFTGRTELAWPDGKIPAWAFDRRIQGWLFSAPYGTKQDRELRQGRWFPGNHFWFRSCVLGCGRRFQDKWLTEPDFMLGLVEDGVKAICGPDAIATHRVQRALLNPATALARAVKVGRTFAEVQLVPYRSSVPHARKACEHPLAARLYCFGAWIKWGMRCICLKNVTDSEARFGERLYAIERREYFREILRILACTPEYQIPRSKRVFQARNQTLSGPML